MNGIRSDYDIYVDYYKKLVKDNPGDPNRQGSWGGVSQDDRYEALIEDKMYTGATILEVGAGTGGFLEYMLAHNVKFKDYCGLDILDDMKRINEKKYPQYRFLNRNLVVEPLNEKFDIVVLCGVFHLKIHDGKKYMYDLLRSSFDCCTRAMYFNFVSSYVNFKEDDFEYHDPIDLMRFCIEELSPRVDIRHHYWKCDVSCRVYR